MSQPTAAAAACIFSEKTCGVIPVYPPERSDSDRASSMKTAESVSFAALKIPSATVAIRTFAAITMAFRPVIPFRIVEPGIGPKVGAFIRVLPILILPSYMFQSLRSLFTADVDGGDLANCFRHDLPVIFTPVAHRPAGLADDHAHGVCLVQEAEFSGLLSLVAGVGKDPSLVEDLVDVGDKTAGKSELVAIAFEAFDPPCMGGKVVPAQRAG